MARTQSSPLLSASCGLEQYHPPLRFQPPERGDFIPKQKGTLCWTETLAGPHPRVILSHTSKLAFYVLRLVYSFFVFKSIVYTKISKLYISALLS